MPGHHALEQGAFAALQAAGLEPLRPRFDVELHGSPQRCAERMAATCRSMDHGEETWMAEHLLPGQEQGREAVANVLHALWECGFVRSAPYRAFTRQGSMRFVCPAPDGTGGMWQVSPYLFSEPLPRPRYLEEPHPGESLGRCLAALQQAGERVPQSLLAALPPLDLEAYVSGLMLLLQETRPALAEALSHVANGLPPLWRAWPDLPQALAHGDCHPLNVLWRRRGKGLGVLAMIDWEFCGLRPTLFDLANCLGCVGIEHPTGLGGDFALGLLRSFLALRPEQSMAVELLPRLVLALRFGWLAEWLRFGDAEMLELEVEYMHLLAREAPALQRIWAAAK